MPTVSPCCAVRRASLSSKSWGFSTACATAAWRQPGFSKTDRPHHPSDHHRILKQAVMPVMEQPQLPIVPCCDWSVRSVVCSYVQRRADSEAAHGPAYAASGAGGRPGSGVGKLFPASDPRDLRAAIAQILRSAGCLADAAAYDAASSDTVPPETSGIKSGPA